jgi:beta-galactosidase
VDNGNLKDVDSYVGTSRKAWHGRAMVVIKSTHRAGDIQLIVSTPGLPESTLTIKSAMH